MNILMSQNHHSYLVGGHGSRHYSKVSFPYLEVLSKFPASYNVQVISFASGLSSLHTRIAQIL